MGTSTTDGFNWSNVAAGSYPSVTNNGVAITGRYLMGGTYAFFGSATWSAGNAQIQALSNDGSTWVNIGTSLTANGMNTIDIPPGTYRVTITTATASYGSFVRVPR